jgi:hypothetical protein
MKNFYHEKHRKYRLFCPCAEQEKSNSFCFRSIEVYCSDISSDRCRRKINDEGVGSFFFWNRYAGDGE